MIFPQDGWVNKNALGCTGLYLLQRMGMLLDDGFGQQIPAIPAITAGSF